MPRDTSRGVLKEQRKSRAPETGDNTCPPIDKRMVSDLTEKSKVLDRVLSQYKEPREALKNVFPIAQETQIKPDIISYIINNYDGPTVCYGGKIDNPNSGPGVCWPPFTGDIDWTDMLCEQWDTTGVNAAQVGDECSTQQPQETSDLVNAQVYFIDANSDNFLFGTAAAGTALQSISDYNAEIEGTTSVAYGDNMLLINNTGQYCIGPITIPNNWLCCTEANDYNTTSIEGFSISPGNVSPPIWDDLPWDDGSGNYNTSVMGAFMGYSNQLGCHCPVSYIDGEGLVCDHSYMLDEGDAYVAFTSWHQGTPGDTYGDFGGSDIDSMAGNYPTFTDFCTSEPAALIQACLDDGFGTYGTTPQFPALTYPDGEGGTIELAPAQPACNFIGAPDQVDVDGNTFSGDYSDYIGTSAQCDYDCFGCTDEEAYNTSEDASITNLSQLTCVYAGCRSENAYNYDDQWYNQWANMDCSTADDTQTNTGCEICDFTQGSGTTFCGDPEAVNYICDEDYLTDLGDTGDDMVLYCVDGVAGTTNTNIASFNMDSVADGGVCLYPEDGTQSGCTDPTALNYAPTATIACDPGDGVTESYPNACCIYAFCNNDDSAVVGYSEFHPSSTGAGSIGPTVPWSTAYGTVTLADAEEDNGIIDGYDYWFAGVVDNTLCEFEGCRHSVGVPDEYMSGEGTLNPDLGPGTTAGLQSTDCDGTGRNLYYYHIDNAGCEDYDANGDSLGINSENSDCCVRPGCTDPNASNGPLPGDTYPPTIHANPDGTPNTGGCVEDASATSLGYDDVPVGCDYIQYGCIDPEAINYNPVATDQLIPNNCEYCEDVLAYQCYPEIPTAAQHGGAPIEGAVDNPKWFYCATINNMATPAVESVPVINQTFEFPVQNYTIPGCSMYEFQGTLSCNYNEYAWCDNNGDGLYEPCVEDCEWPEEGYDCDGNCINDSDGDGICDEDEVNIPGCTDPDALNYYCDDPQPGYECSWDGEIPSEVYNSGCEYIIPGCTDEDADNYNSEANEDDGSCLYSGCICCPEYSDNYNNYSALTLDAAQGGESLPDTLHSGLCADEGGCIGIYGGYCYREFQENGNPVNGNSEANHCDHLVAIHIQGGGSYGMGWNPNTPPRFGWYGTSKCCETDDYQCTQCENGSVIPSSNGTGFGGEDGWYATPSNTKVGMSTIYCKPIPGSYVDNYYVNGSPDTTGISAAGYNAFWWQQCGSYCGGGNWEDYGCNNSNDCESTCANHPGGPEQFRSEGC